MWRKVFDYDFNNPRGMFVIHEDSPDFTEEENFPQLGEEVFLVYLETLRRKRGDLLSKSYFDSGFGIAVKITGIEIKDVGGHRARFYETDYMERANDNRS